MFRLYLLSLILSCLLISHHGSSPSHGGGSTGSSEYWEIICSQLAQGTDPYFYEHCGPHHALSLEEIGKISDIKQRFKEHIKHQSVTHGTALNLLVLAQKDHTNIPFSECMNIASIGGQTAFMRTLAQEIE